MTLEYKRLSLNTCLKNARIFDEDSWKSETDLLAAIKTEPLDDDETDPWEYDSVDTKQEPQLTETVDIPIKHEKFEFESDDTTNTGNLEPKVKEERRNLKRKNVTHIKEENCTENTMHSPKKRLQSTSSQNSSPQEKKLKNGPITRPKRKLESDPIVLRRRQKQIDYGKNTIGYDRYSQNVPKGQRSYTDPQTPDKYRSYSRRGWDGLIKQWRLQLHKYDPE